MAKVSSIFKIRGRVGNTIFTTRNGKCYARAVPAVVRNPNTPKQQAVRSRFRVAVRFYGRLRVSCLGDIWQQAGRNAKTTGFALFMKTNLQMFNAKGKIADYEGLRLAMGSRSGVFGLKAFAEEEGRVTLCWLKEGEEEVLDAHDRLMVALLYADRTFSPEIVWGVKAERKDGTATFRLPRERKGAVHVYCFFVAPGGGSFSDSQHVVV